MNPVTARAQDGSSAAARCGGGKALAPRFLDALRAGRQPGSGRQSGAGARAGGGGGGGCGLLGPQHHPRLGTALQALLRPGVLLRGGSKSHSWFVERWGSQGW